MAQVWCPVFFRKWVCAVQSDRAQGALVFLEKPDGSVRRDALGFWGFIGLDVRIVQV